MRQNSLRDLLLRLRRPSRTERRKGGCRRRFGYRPWLEALEELVMPDAVRWINPAGGDWGVAANWDAGHVPGPGDDATIDLGGITVTHSTGTDSVNSLSVAGATFNLSGGVLQARAVQLQGAGTLFKLSGGTLQNAIVSETPDAQMVGTTAGGVLDGVTLNGNLDLTQAGNVGVGLRNSLLLNGTILVGNAAGTTYGTISLLNNETIDGTGSGGSIQLGGSGNNRLFLYDPGAAVAVTFGPNLTVHGANGSLVSQYGHAGSGFSNQGTITADTAGGTIGLNFGTSGGGNSGTLEAQGGTLNVSGTWSNSGTLLAASGVLSLGGTWNTNVNPSPVDGTLTLGGTLDNSNGQLTLTADAGGTVNFAGTLNSANGTLMLAGMGDFRLAGGTLLNGTISETSPAVLTGTTAGGVLDGVTLNGNLDLTQAGNVGAGLRNGFLLNGAILVGNAAGTTYGTISLLNSETIDGTGGGGSVLLGGNGNNRLFLYDPGVAVAVTFGHNLTVHGASGSLVSQYGHAGSGFSNQGPITADTAGGTIGINFGTSGGGNSGTLEAQGGTLNVSGTWSNSGTLLAASGILSLGGTWNTSVDPAPVDGTLTLGGTLDNSNGQLTLTADASGTVNFAGTLNSTNGTLTLTGGGAFNLVGGTLLNGTVSGMLNGTTAGGVLDGVTLNGTLDLSQTSNVAASLRDGLLLNGVVLVGNAAGTTYGTLSFLNSETIDGTGGGGSVLLGGNGNNRLFLYDPGAAVAVTFGPNLTVHGKSGSLLSQYGHAGSGFSNQGTISADTAGGTISVNFGSSGGVNSGTLEAQGGTLNVSGTWRNSGTLLAASGTLVLGGTWSTSVNPSPVDGALTLAGTLDNSNGQLTLTADIGGVVNLAGTLNSANGSLTLTGAGIFYLAGGTLLNGTVNGVLTGTTAGGTLDGVTLNGTLDLTGAGGVIAGLRDGLRLNGTILVGNGAGSTYGTVDFLNSETIDGTGGGGSIQLGGNGNNRLFLLDPSAAVAVTLGSRLTVHGKNGGLVSYYGHAGSGFSNQGTISADTAGGTISVNFGSSGGVNSGTLQAQGGTLNVSGTWNNSGTLLAASGTLVLGSPYNSNGQLTITANAGGVVNFTSALTNTAATLTLAGAGVFNLVGATITGGTINGSLTGTTAGGALVGVTLNGTLDLTAASNVGVSLRDGLTLQGSILVGNAAGTTYGNLYFLNTQTVDGSATMPGTIVLGGSASNRLYLYDTSAAVVATFGPRLTIHGKNGTLASYQSRAGSSFSNQGIIAADSPGGTIGINFGTGGGNSGTLEAQGGTLNVSGTWTNSGILLAASGTLALGGTLNNGNGHLTVTANAGGFVNFAGTVTNTSGTLTLSGAGVFNLVGGTIGGGTVSGVLTGTTAGGGLVGVTLNGTLDLTGANNVAASLRDGLTLQGSILVGNAAGTTYGTLYFLNTQTVDGSAAMPGAVVLGGSATNRLFLYDTSAAVVATLGANLTVHGMNGSLVSYQNRAGSTFANQGMISADIPGGTIGVNFGTSGSNTGTLAAQGGTLSVTGAWTNSGSVQALGGTVGLAGVLSATGSFNAGTGGTLAFTATSVTLASSSVVGGAGTVSFASTVTTTGTYNVAGTTRVTAGTLTFDAGSRVLTAGALVISGGTVHFDSGSAARTATLTLSGGTLTGADTLTVTGMATWTGGTMSGTGLTLAQGGLTLSGSIDLPLDHRALTNAGRAADTQTGRLLVSNGAQITNQAGATWDFQGNGSIVQGTGIAGGFTNAGTLQKSAGTGTTTIDLVFNNTGTVNANAGTISLSTVVQRTGSMLLGGTWGVGAGATLNLNGLITDSAATITLDGATAALPAINTLANNTGSFTILDGRNLTSPGNFTNAGKLTVGAGSTLTVNGNYTQTAAGSFGLQIGSDPSGNQVSRAHVTGMASLSGTLNVQFVNGYGPLAGNTYHALTFASVAGNFGTLNGAAFGRFPLFQENVTATSVDLVTLVNAPDLAVDTITVPATGTPGQNTTVTYTVKNLSVSTAQGPWYDSVYLTAKTTLDASAQLIGRVNHKNDVAGNNSYMETLTAPVPGALPGTYHVIVVADSRGLVPDINRMNNTLLAMGTINLSMPTLNLGDSAMGTIANGQDVYYQLNVPVGHDVQVAASFGAANAAELYVRYQGVPSPATYDQFAFTPNQMQQAALVPSPQGGMYYILLHGREGATAGTTFHLMTIDLPFGVRGVSPNHGGNIGFTTLTVTGTKFTPATQVSLVAPDGTRYQAFSVLYKDSDTVFATVDLTGASVGTYDVRVDDQGRTATDPGAFRVTAGSGGNVVYNMSAPNFVRNGTMGTVTVTYENIGTTDALAPLLQLSAQNAVVRLPDQPTFVGPAVQFLAINMNGPAGVLPPGVLGHITLSFQASPTAPLGSQISFALGVSDSNQAINWAGVKASFRPPYVATDAWDATWNNFVGSFGSTAGQLETVLDRDATYLSQLGEYVYDVSTLTGFEIEKANDFLPVPTLASKVDAASQAPGPALTFSRQFLQPLPGRYQLGRLGRGWTDNWDISATTDVQGNVTILASGGVRAFGKQADGSYQAGPGDYGVLTLTGGVYRLREKDGTTYSFRPNGKLDYVQDRIGNRITVGYIGNQLTSLTASNGEQLVLAYNGQGRIRQVTDAFGQVTTYGYDTSGEHLLTVTGPQGVIQYTYVSGQGAAREHAMASITYPTGNHLFFDYDPQGRMIDQHRDGNAEAVTYAYGAGGQLITTDATQHSTTGLFNEFGLPGLVIDPLGRSTAFKYDANQHLVLITGPDGTSYAYSYDNQGNLARQVDPLGHVTNFTYDPQFNNLLSLTDARSNTTNYRYDSSGSLLAIVYPNGSQHQFSYDPQGNPIESINGRGNAIYSNYNANGQLVRKDFADGTHIDYTYDTHGNLHTATDVTGTTVLDWDPVADRLNKVTYPDGRFLAFSYDRGGTLRTKSVDQAGFTVNYIYDAVGRLTELRDAQNQLIARYTYVDEAGHDDGRLHRKDLGNGTYTTYSYDPAGQMLRLVNYAPNGAVNSRFDYTYDNPGRVKTETTLDGTWTYDYDGIGELTHAVFASTNPDIPSQDLTYFYDAGGNRTRTILNGVTTDYVANNMNQYTQVGTAQYGYDADGNLTSIRDVFGNTTYVYNDESRLTGMTLPDGSIWTYQYDPFGSRSAAAQNGRKISYLIDPGDLGNIVGEYDGSGSLVAHYTYGLGLVSRSDLANSATYYDFDALGSTVGVSNSAGNYANRYTYLPSGEIASTTQSVANPFTFVGELGVRNDGNSQYYMRARDELSGLGRFLTPDPINTAGGINLYSYASNSPVALVDATGTDPFDDWPSWFALRDWLRSGPNPFAQENPWYKFIGRQLFDPNRFVIRGPNPFATGLPEESTVVEGGGTALEAGTEGTLVESASGGPLVFLGVAAITSPAWGPAAGTYLGNAWGQTINNSPFLRQVLWGLPPKETPRYLIIPTPFNYYDL